MGLELIVSCLPTSPPSPSSRPQKKSHKMDATAGRAMVQIQVSRKMRATSLVGTKTSLAPGTEGCSSLLGGPRGSSPSARKWAVLHVAPGPETKIKRLPEAIPLLVFRRDLVDSLICWLALFWVVFSL